MADNVIDIVTKLSYETETSPIEKSIKAIDENVAAMQRLQKQKRETAKEDIAAHRDLDRQIDQHKQKLTQEVQANETLIRTNQRVRTSLNQYGIALASADSRLNGLHATNKRATQSLIDMSRIVQDLPYGFIGIANNLDPALLSFKALIKESGGVRGALKTLGSSLIGAGGIGFALSVVTSLLVSYGDELFRSADAADAAADGYKKFLDTIKGDVQATTRAINEQTIKFSNLIGLINSPKSSAATKKGAIAELKRMFPAYLKDIKDEAFLQGKVNDEYDKIRTGIDAKEKSNLATKTAVNLAGQEAEAKQRIADAQKRINDAEKELGQQRKKFTGSAASEDAVANAERNLNSAKTELSLANTAYNNVVASRKKAQAEAKTQAQAAGDLFFDNNSSGEHKDPYQQALQSIEDRFNVLEAMNGDLAQVQQSEIELSQSVENIGEEEYKREAKRLDILKKIISLQLENQKLQEQIDTANKFSKKGDAARYKSQISENTVTVNELRAEQKRNQEHITPVKSIGSTSEIDNKAINEAMQKTKIGKNVIEELLKEEKDKTKETLSSIENSYQSFANTIIGTFQRIYDAQIRLLDQEIAYRESKMSYAVELAERGNVELLNSEKERLEEAQKKREEVTNRQLALNAVMEASNSALALTEALLVVTNAGKTGDPYSTAARIAAAVAALAAGFGLVTNLIQASKGFKDGVIDLDGPGTTKSDSIAARLSKGESVMTANETRKYKPELLAIRNGDFDKKYIPIQALINPYTMPVPIQSKNEYKSLEKRLDNIAGLLENNGIYVHTGVTNGHIATIVESQRRFEQNRMTKRG